MKTTSRRNSLLALAALAGITAYILACSTAFSPDDSKVLYPTVNPKSGATAIAIYDRATKQSRTILVPAAVDLKTCKTEPVLLRPQWAAGGKDVLVAWPGGTGSTKDDTITLAVIPTSGGVTRLFYLSELKDAVQLLRRPLPVSGNFVFIAHETDSNTTSIVRLDLSSGETCSETNLPTLALIPAAQDGGIVYMANKPDGDGGEVGLLSPNTLARTPLYEMSPDLPKPDLEDGNNFLTVSRDGKRIAFSDTADGKSVCRIVQSGKLAKTLQLPKSASKIAFGNGQFSPAGDVLYISFADGGAGSTNGTFGVIELPLDGTTIRRHTLVSDFLTMDDVFQQYFQLDVSHDGKALAIASTYLAYEDNHNLQPADCALFLISLDDPSRKITRVPVPLPPVEVLSK